MVLWYISISYFRESYCVLLVIQLSLLCLDDPCLWVASFDHLVCLVVHFIDSHTKGRHLSGKSLQVCGDKILSLFSCKKVTYTCRKSECKNNHCLHVFLLKSRQVEPLVLNSAYIKLLLHGLNPFLDSSLLFRSHQCLLQGYSIKHTQQEVS